MSAADVVADRLGPIDRPSAMNDHVGSGVGQFDGDRPPDAARRSGHNHTLPQQRSLSQSAKQLDRGLTENRVDDVGGDFDQRTENESPIRQPRMRHGQPRLVDDLVPEEQQIEIDRSRAILDATFPTELFFDRKQGFEQLLRRQVRGYLGDGVEIPALPGRSADRIGFPVLRRPDDVDARLAIELGEGGVEQPFPVAKVASQGYIGCDGHATRWDAAPPVDRSGEENANRIMTQLLVSVRTAEEGETAVDAGADIVDIKEPARGSLGRADAEVIQAVAESVSARCCISAALGELVDEPETVPTLPVDFVKVGLAGCGRNRQWPERLARFAHRLAQDKGPHLVIVAYGDWHRAGAPPPSEVWRTACRLGLPGMLFDTWRKDGLNLLEWMSIARLQQWVVRCRDAGRFLAVAGSLTVEVIRQLIRLQPDILAVRGAACRHGSRRGPIDADAVRQLADLVHGSPSRSTHRTTSILPQRTNSIGNH